MAAKPEPVLLIIADISGYTRYMTANAKTLAHRRIIITELVIPPPLPQRYDAYHRARTTDLAAKSS